MGVSVCRLTHDMTGCWAHPHVGHIPCGIYNFDLGSFKYCKKKTLVFKRNYNRKKKLKSRSETENDIVIDKNVYDDILMFRLSTFKKSSARVCAVGDRDCSGESGV